jgi:hypothetical protein
MEASEIELPSNKKFGFFFAFVFGVCAAYLFHAESATLAYGVSIVSVSMLIFSICKSDALAPLNRLWMGLGLMLSTVFTPIVLGVIFFALFTPTGVLMRLRGRDELRLKLSRSATHWILRSESSRSVDFTRQF